MTDSSRSQSRFDRGRAETVYNVLPTRLEIASGETARRDNLFIYRETAYLPLACQLGCSIVTSRPFKDARAIDG